MQANHPGITLLPVLYDNDLPATAAVADPGDARGASRPRRRVRRQPNTGQGIATGLKAAGKQGTVKVAAFDAEPDESSP